MIMKYELGGENGARFPRRFHRLADAEFFKLTDAVSRCGWTPLSLIEVEMS